ncbi:hypothetical protein Clacol_006370 [Clathrus columnatus]|uniref:adenosine deaminase n=1 Tax=Clathrus columnatus TaxID=1419009 RepID=A0AAV5AHH3_9AGAM|nr:hypothetical protein Clacol_006370 [Clathrus columnatus]
MSYEDLYWSARHELITKDRSLQRDYTSYQNLQSSAKKAEEIIRQLRHHELSTVWTGTHEEIPHLFPGMEFLTVKVWRRSFTARSVIESTKLFEILRKMPKAALLHVHMEASVDAAGLLRLALGHPAIHVRLTGPVHENHSDLLPLEIQPVFNVECGHGLTTDITSPDYKTGTWIPLTKARETYSLGEDKFDEMVKSALTINPIDAYKTHNTITKVITKSGPNSLIVTQLLKYNCQLPFPIWEQYVYNFFQSCIDDGIMYAEARISFRQKTMEGEGGKHDVTHDQWIEMFDRALLKIRKELLEGDGDRFFNAKIIYTTLRWVTLEELEWYLEDCLMLKQKYPHIIAVFITKPWTRAGFDLVGDENVYHPLKYYVKPLLRFKERQKELGIEVPFLFHAGETLGDGNDADENLFDAILLGTKRIGHGYSLAKHPHLMKLCQERDIAVEVCPISNEVLRLTSSMPMHPLPTLLNHGIPVALATDDPSIFGNLLSHDLYQVLISSEVTGLETLAVAARDSLRYSMLEPDEKVEALSIWEKRWQTFVEEICYENRLLNTCVMGKRKKSSRKPTGPRRREPLETSFMCLYCNHEKSVTVKLDRKEGIAYLSYLTEPIDIYSEWIDAADEAEKTTR